MSEWRPEDCESRTDCHQRHEVLNQQQARIAELEAENERLNRIIDNAMADEFFDRDAFQSALEQGE